MKLKKGFKIPKKILDWIIWMYFDNQVDLIRMTRCSLPQRLTTAVPNRMVPRTRSLPWTADRRSQNEPHRRTTTAFTTCSGRPWLPWKRSAKSSPPRGRPPRRSARRPTPQTATCRNTRSSRSSRTPGRGNSCTARAACPPARPRSTPNRSPEVTSLHNRANKPTSMLSKCLALTNKVFLNSFSLGRNRAGQTWV